jgi:CheY-like chemotaxis protein
MSDLDFQFHSDHPAAEARVLVVDDEPTLRMGFRLALLTEGYTVDLARNGEEALAKLQDKDADFDLMVLDLRMPGIDGIGVLTHLAAHDLTIPTVIASAQMDDRVALHCLRLGAVDFLNKPIRPNDLRHIAHEVLLEEQSYQEADADPVHEARCLLRRRKPQKALTLLLETKGSLPAKNLWQRIACAVTADRLESDGDASPISLHDLTTWNTAD